MPCLSSMSIAAGKFGRRFGEYACRHAELSARCHLRSLLCRQHGRRRAWLYGPLGRTSLTPAVEQNVTNNIYFLTPISRRGLPFLPPAAVSLWEVGRRAAAMPGSQMPVEFEVQSVKRASEMPASREVDRWA